LHSFFKVGQLPAYFYTEESLRETVKKEQNIFLSNIF